MTSKIVQFPENGMTMVITRLTDYTVQHYAGLADVPHLCVKVRHPNGFAWFGISIVAVPDRKWLRQYESSIRERFMNAMSQLIDLTELDSDLDLLMRSIQDVCTQRRKPIMLGAGNNEFIQLTSTNNVQLELYRDEVKPDTVSYGGYFMVVGYNNQSFPAMVYHRGIVLYNYITKETALDLVRTELLSKFPEFFSNPSLLTVDYQDIMQIPRNRNKWAKVK